MASPPDPLVQVGVYPAPSTSQVTSEVPPASRLLNMQYYLTEGLKAATYREYKDNRSFAGAVKSQSKVARAGDGVNYVVFSAVTEEKLTNIERIRDDHYKQLRFFYLNDPETLIVKIMPSLVHELAASLFANLLKEKITLMGLGGMLCDVRGTRYRGIASSKEGDSAFKPWSRSREGDWPTLVIESGVSETMARLRVDAQWWLANSSSAVNTVLLFAVGKTSQTIQVEKWEMGDAVNTQAMRTNPSDSIIMPKRADKIDIPQPAAAGHALTLGFKKIFDRDATKGSLEGDIVLTPVDLAQWADKVWHWAQ